MPERPPAAVTEAKLNETQSGICKDFHDASTQTDLVSGDPSAYRDLTFFTKTPTRKTKRNRMKHQKRRSRKNDRTPDAETDHAHPEQAVPECLSCEEDESAIEIVTHAPQSTEQQQTLLTGCLENMNLVHAEGYLQGEVTKLTDRMLLSQRLKEAIGRLRQAESAEKDSLMKEVEILRAKWRIGSME